MSAQTIRTLYGLALLVFIAGAGDFSMYVTQRYENFQQGLSDQLALTGLGVWWVLALGLAGFTYKKSKKAGASEESEESGESGASGE
jgi:hypothetical protein